MSNTKGGDKQYRHNQQLEELRNLQDKLSGEKASWAATKEQEEKELEEKRQELLRLQVSKVFDLNSSQNIYSVSKIWFYIYTGRFS